MHLKNLIASKTIGFKLTLWYSAFFVLSSFLLFMLAYVFLSQTLQEDDHMAIKSQLNEIAIEYVKGGIFELRSHIKNEFLQSKKFRKRTHFLYRLADRHNKTIQIFFPHQWDEFKLQRLEKIYPGKKNWINVPSKNSNHSYSLEVSSIKLPDGGWLQVGMSTESRLRILNSFLESFMYVVGVLLVIGCICGYYLSRRALRPIRYINQTVRNIVEGQMDARVPQTNTNDELGEMVRLFNNMLARIQTLIDGMKGSLDNVAHELRTPMTRMHNIAYAALSTEGDEYKYKEALEDFVEESNRILRMLNTLMDICEAENGVMNLNKKEFRVKELIDPVVEVYSFIAEEKGLYIETDIKEDFIVNADYDRISQALANLVDNAIKYTPASNPPVLVQAWQTQTESVISVTDKGKGIAQDELSRIWDRLYRGRENHNYYNKGLGLGLAQVQAILSAHNGRVDVSSNPGEGTTFRIILNK